MTPTLNNQPLPAGKSTAVAGTWTIAAGPEQFVNVNGNPRAKGSVTLNAVAGTVYKVAVTGGFYAEITATPAQPITPPPARKCIVGTSTPPGGKKLPGDRVVHEGASLFRLLDSAGANLEQTGGYEADEIAYFRAINPKAIIVGSILNPWNKDGYDNATDERVRQYIQRNIGWIRLLDIVGGPNEPEIYATRGTPSEIATVRRVWDTAVDELAKQGIPHDRIAGVEWFRRSLIVEDCAKYEVSCIHTHDDGGDRDGFLADIRSRVGARPLYATETSWPKREPTQEDQAKGMALTMGRAARYCDGAIYYVGRSDPKEMAFDYVAILNSDATPRPAMLAKWRELTRKPVIVFDGTWNLDRTDRSVSIVAGVPAVLAFKPERPADVVMHAKGLPNAPLAYIDHLTNPEDDYFAPGARAARYMPTLDAADVAGVPTILYSTIGRYHIGLNPGNFPLHAKVRECNDTFWRIVGPKCFGVGYSAYVMNNHPAELAAIDTREAVRLANGKPVIPFISIGYGDDPATLVPIDRFSQQVRAVIDAGATHVIVWAGLADRAVCRPYLEAARAV